MSKQLREQYIKQPPRLKDESRVWNPKHGPAFCVQCRNYYDERTWKYPTPLLWRKLKSDTEHKVRFYACPACKTIKEHLFGGKIEISDIPEEYLFDLLRLIYRFAEAAERHSPEHRLIAMSGGAKKLVVLTTENQLAGRLAKKITESFKKRTLADIVFSQEPYKTAFIRLQFSESPVELTHKRKHTVKKDRTGHTMRIRRKP